MDFTLTTAATTIARRRRQPSLSERLRHIECAYLLLSGKHAPERIAALYGVSRRTVYLWRDAALTYDDPESVGLRRLMGLPDYPEGDA